MANTNLVSHLLEHKMAVNHTLTKPLRRMKFSDFAPHRSLRPSYLSCTPSFPPSLLLILHPIVPSVPPTHLAPHRSLRPSYLSCTPSFPPSLLLILHPIVPSVPPTHLAPHRSLSPSYLPCTPSFPPSLLLILHI